MKVKGCQKRFDLMMMIIHQTLVLFNNINLGSFVFGILSVQFQNGNERLDWIGSLANETVLLFEEKRVDRLLKVIHIHLAH